MAHGEPLIKVLIVALILVFIASRLRAHRRDAGSSAAPASAHPIGFPAPPSAWAARSEQARRLTQAADAYRAHRDAQAFTILSHPDTDWAAIAGAARSCPEWAAQQLAATLAQPGGHAILIDEIQHATPQRRDWILTTLQTCVTVYPIAA